MSASPGSGRSLPFGAPRLGLTSSDPRLAALLGPPSQHSSHTHSHTHSHSHQTRPQTVGAGSDGLSRTDYLPQKYSFSHTYRQRALATSAAAAGANTLANNGADIGNTAPMMTTTVATGGAAFAGPDARGGKGSLRGLASPTATTPVKGAYNIANSGAGSAGNGRSALVLTCGPTLPPAINGNGDNNAIAHTLASSFPSAGSEQSCISSSSSSSNAGVGAAADYNSVSSGNCVKQGQTDCAERGSNHGDTVCLSNFAAMSPVAGANAGLSLMLPPLTLQQQQQQMQLQSQLQQQAQPLVSSRTPLKYKGSGCSASTTKPATHNSGDSKELSTTSFIQINTPTKTALTRHNTGVTASRQNINSAATTQSVTGPNSRWDTEPLTAKDAITPRTAGHDDSLTSAHGDPLSAAHSVGGAAAGLGSRERLFALTAEVDERKVQVARLEATITASSQALAAAEAAVAGLTQSLAGTTARADAAESALALAREQVAEHARARGAAEAARDAAVSKRCGAEADAGTAWREVDRLKAVAAAAIEAKEAAETAAHEQLMAHTALVSSLRSRLASASASAAHAQAASDVSAAHREAAAARLAALEPELVAARAAADKDREELLKREVEAERARALLKDEAQARQGDRAASAASASTAAKLAKERGALKAEASVLRAAVARKSDELDALAVTLANVRREAQRQVAAVASERDAAAARRDALREEVAALSDALRTAQATAVAAGKREAELTGTIARAGREMTRLRAAAAGGERAEAEVEVLRGQLSALEDKLEETKRARDAAERTGDDAGEMRLNFARVSAELEARTASGEAAEAEAAAARAETRAARRAVTEAETTTAEGLERERLLQETVKVKEAEAEAATAREENERRKRAGVEATVKRLEAMVGLKENECERLRGVIESMAALKAAHNASKR